MRLQSILGIKKIWSDIIKDIWISDDFNVPFVNRDSIEKISPKNMSKKNMRTDIYFQLEFHNVSLIGWIPGFLGLLNSVNET